MAAAKHNNGGRPARFGVLATRGASGLVWQFGVRDSKLGCVWWVHVQFHAPDKLEVLAACSAWRKPTLNGPEVGGEPVYYLDRAWQSSPPSWLTFEPSAMAVAQRRMEELPSGRAVDVRELINDGRKAVMRYLAGRKFEVTETRAGSMSFGKVRPSPNEW